MGRFAPKNDGGRNAAPLPAAQPAAHVQPPTNGGGISPSLKYGLPIIALVVLGGLGFAFRSQWTTYKAESAFELTFKRTKSALGQVPTANLFNEEQLNKLYKGNSGTIHFVTDFEDGSAPEDDVWVVPPLPEFQTEIPPIRRENVDKLIATTLPEHITRFKGPKGITHVVALYVDETDGVDGSFQGQIEAALNARVWNRFDQNADGLILFACSISNKDQLDCHQAAVYQSGTRDFTSAQAALAQTKRIRGGANESSVATGLFNAIGFVEREAAKLKKSGERTTPTTHIVLSDGVENYSETVILKSRPDLLEPSKYGDLTKLLTKLQPVPRFSNGSRVYWYRPTTTQESSTLLLKVQAYWKDLISRNGAYAEMTF